MTRDREYAARTAVAVSVAFLTALAAPARADAETAIAPGTLDWTAMRQTAVKASNILRGEVTSNTVTIGTVEELVLDENASRIEYVLFNAGHPWTLFTGNGFVRFEDVALERGAGLSEIDVRLEGTPEIGGPDDIEITRAEADYRLASRVIGEPIRLDGEEYYEIEDVLIDPGTGEIRYFVVGMDEGAAISLNRRAIPAGRVALDQGQFMSDLSLGAIEADQPFDEALLW